VIPEGGKNILVAMPEENVPTAADRLARLRERRGELRAGFGGGA